MSVMMKPTKNQKMTTESGQSYYCSQKFWFLSIDIEKINQASCCSASFEKIDLEWLSNNPGKIFNTPSLISDRDDMLKNQPVTSCASACWVPESKNMPSRRINFQSQKKTHNDLETSPEILNVLVGNDCNMTCVYCCKQFSSAWLHDLQKNGAYDTVKTTDDRYDINHTDRILLKLSQKKIANAKHMSLLLDEIKQISQNPVCKTIIISGGEPFLYLNLADLISTISEKTPILIYSGLGVDSKRFTRELEKISKYKNISVVISAENTETLYEFARYGNTWSRFMQNLEILEKFDVNYEFNATLSNLTVVGLYDFVEKFQEYNITFQHCTDPEFLQLCVLDSESKKMVLEHSKILSKEVQKSITRALDVEPTEIQRLNFKNYLWEFSRRRNLDLSIFPNSLLQWLEI